MGSTFAYVSIPKAAEFLEVTVRTVNRYIRRGLLRTEKRKGCRVIPRDDLHTLKEQKTRKDLPYAVNKVTIGMLSSQIQMLQKNMDVVLRILDLRHEPLGLDAGQLENLHAMAQYHMQEQWSPQQEDMWVSTFIRMKLEDIEEMSKMIEDDQPWRPFFQLCRAMLQAPCDVDNKLKLNAGKANIEKIAHIWASTKGVRDHALDNILKKDDTGVRKIVRKRKPKDD